jgi:hypothetical protein
MDQFYVESNNYSQDCNGLFSYIYQEQINIPNFFQVLLGIKEMVTFSIKKVMAI